MVHFNVVFLSSTQQNFVLLNIFEFRAGTIPILILQKKLRVNQVNKSNMY
jgi:hypothetical protein